LQYVSTSRDVTLFGDPNGSLLFAGKLNWQWLMLLADGDQRELSRVGSRSPDDGCS
jgi:hypothetical protein